jgi:hypothetical protein
MASGRVKKFNEFLLEGLYPILESTSKADSYRSIALKMAEIFSLYGFFFAQKPGYMKAGAWMGMMKDIASIQDPEEKWEKIVELSTFLQQKVASPQLAPRSRDDFGFRGQYSYAKETADLPKATGFLQTASKASLGTFTPEEKIKAMEILDRTLLSVKPFALMESISIFEREKYLPPTNTDLLKSADGIGSKIIRIYDELEVTKSTFPEFASEIDSFISGSVDPLLNRLKKMIEEEIPEVGEKAAEGYMKSLDSFNREVDEISQKSQELRGKVLQGSKGNYASKAYEDSAQKIIDRVKEGIRKQGNLNFGFRKMTDVIAGTTERTPETMGDAQARSKIEKIKKKRQSSVDLSKHIGKKY